MTLQISFSVPQIQICCDTDILGDDIFKTTDNINFDSIEEYGLIGGGGSLLTLYVIYT